MLDSNVRYMAKSDPVADALQRARGAQGSVADWPQTQVDEAVAAIAWHLFQPDVADRLVGMAIEESGIGDPQDSLLRFRQRVHGALSDMHGQATSGVVEDDLDAGIQKWAKPVGVVGVMAPSTAPNAAIALTAVKTRNAAIFCSNPSVKRTASGAVAMLFVLSAVMAPPFGLGLVLLSDRGFTAEQIGWSAGYGGSILCAVAALACGRLASRFRLTAMLCAGVVLKICLSLAWAGVAMGREASWLLGGAVMVIQIGVYAMMSAMWMLATLRLVSLRRAASEIALINAVVLFAGIVAPNVAGLAIDSYAGWTRFFVAHAVVTALAGVATVLVLSRAGLDREAART